MLNHKFYIIIPTRERSETLKYSLMTCLNQDYENFEIIISDNFSQDNTKQIVESFKDERIKYYNTGARLSMSHNYEFALNKIKDDEGFVMLLGDDDGLVVNAILQLNLLLNKDIGIDAIGWSSEKYIWPNYPSKRNGLLTIGLEEGGEMLSGDHLMKNITCCTEGYDRLPILYKGLVNITLINKVREKSGGLFFHSMIPDVYSAVALTAVTEKMLWSKKAYTIDGISGKSNAATFIKDDDEHRKNSQFLQEPNIPYHPKMVMCTSGYLMQLECIYQAIDNKVFELGYEDIDIYNYFDKAIAQQVPFDSFQFNFIRDSILKTAELNNLNYDRVKDILNKYKPKPFNNKYDFNVSGYNYFKKRIEVDCNKLNVTNVFDAATLHQTILSNKKKYTNIFSAVSSNLTFIVREILKRI